MAAEGGPTGDAARDPSVVALEEALARRDQPREFSEAGLEALFVRQGDYLEELGTAAIHHARRNRADVVSAADVERADELIRGGIRTRRAAAFDALGGVLAGAGVGEFVDVLSDDDPGALAIALPTVFMLLGAVLLTAALRR